MPDSQEKIIRGDKTTMLSYERHLLVITVIAVLIIVASVAAVFLEIPLPFMKVG